MQAARQAEAAGGLDLAVRHRRDAGAHDLGDEGRGVEHEPQQHGEELRRGRRAALHREAVRLRDAPGGRRAASEPADERAATTISERHQHEAARLAGGLELPQRPAPVHHASATPTSEADAGQRLPGPHTGTGNEKPALLR